MPQKNMADETAQLALITFINFIAFIPVVVLVVACFMGTYSQYEMRGILYQAGAVLVLLFLLSVAAVMTLRIYPDRRSGQFRYLFVAAEGVLVLLIAIAGISMAVNTMGFSSVIDPYDTIGLINKAAVRDATAFEQMAVSPQLYIFNSLQWIVMLAFNSGSEIMSIFMLVLHFISAFLTYRVARYAVGRMGAVIAFAMCMLLPSNVASAGIVNPYILSGITVLLHLLVFYFRGSMARKGEEIPVRMVLAVLMGITLGFAVFAEPAAMVLIFFEPVYICFLQKDRNGINPEEFKHTLTQSVIIILLSLITFSSLMQVKAGDLSRSAGQIYNDYFSYMHRGFEFPGDVINVWGLDSYANEIIHYHSGIENQTLYGLVILLAAIYAGASLALKDTASMCLRVMVISEVLVVSMIKESTISHYGALFLLTVMGGGIFEYIYGTLRRFVNDERIRNAFWLAERGREIQVELKAIKEAETEISQPQPVYEQPVVSAAPQPEYEEPQPQPVYEQPVVSVAPQPVYEQPVVSAAPQPEYEQPFIDEAGEMEEGKVLTIDDIAVVKPPEAEVVSDTPVSANAFASFAESDDIFADDPLAGGNTIVIKSLPQTEEIIEKEQKVASEEDFIESPIPMVRKNAGSVMEFDFDISDDDDFDFE